MRWPGSLPRFPWPSWRSADGRGSNWLNLQNAYDLKIAEAGMGRRLKSTAAVAGAQARPRG